MSPKPAPESRLGATFAACKAENRAALIGYTPVGYPTVADSLVTLKTMVDAGCDIVEIGIPYSDPVMDGPTVAKAAQTAIDNGSRVRDVFAAAETVAAAGAQPVVMTYWNLVLKYGVHAFSRDLAAAGGVGLITPNLIPDEGAEWHAASDAHGLDRIYLVAPSSTPERLAMTLDSCRGFVYAASTMGVTGARATVSNAAPELCARVREYSEIPIGVGLGVRDGDQAAEIGAYADGVIVGSAIVSAVDKGQDAVAAVVSDLADGVRRARR
ncbi:tryptophan synthase subunit alpha [Gordonia neofelifaecis]|uniref:Tryptophan synthase alpha chain n=1 Tax=Gordonia neofelifaecis NRRL B-59395 TaxID=644548 RepID=F1YH23_9ACTN|nr:tryptophan synthase subunit alpha [Gordonia neofelifaecis]EGD55938.1 tryptophan synthase subunit alpha [Gordonia neofelifaecis NRRL B-59395]